MTIQKDQQEYLGQILGTNENDKTQRITANEYGAIATDEMDNARRQSFNGLFGSKLVAHRSPYISASFFYNVDTRAIIDKSTNLGGHGIDNNMLYVNTGASANSSGYICTKEVIRYRAGRDAEAMFTPSFAEPKLGLYQRSGPFTDNDGFYIGYNELDFSVSMRKDGIEIVSIAQENFNLDPLDGNGYSGFVLQNPNVNIFRINYGYLGVAPIVFEIYGGYNKGWIPFHVIDISNKQNTTHISNPYLPVAAEIENTTNDTDERMKFGSVYAGTFNGTNENLPDSTSREFTANFKEVGITNANFPIVTVNNKDIYSGKKNYIKSILLYLSVSLEGAQPGTLVIKKLKNIPTGGNWTDVDIDNSILQYSSDTTVDDTNAEILLSVELSKVDKFFSFVNDLNLNLYPNEYVTFFMENASNADINLSFRESERF